LAKQQIPKGLHFLSSFLKDAGRKDCELGWPLSMLVSRCTMGWLVCSSCPTVMARQTQCFFKVVVCSDGALGTGYVQLEVVGIKMIQQGISKGVMVLSNLEGEEFGHLK
jgi:hypothetical protein